MNKILNENPKPMPERVNPVLRDLVKRILNKNPNMRPNIVEILELKEIKEKVFLLKNLNFAFIEFFSKVYAIYQYSNKHNRDQS